MSKEGNMIKLYGLFSTAEGNIVYATNNIKIRTPGGQTAVIGCVMAGGSFDIVANNNLVLTYYKITAPDIVPTTIETLNWNR